MLIVYLISALFLASQISMTPLDDYVKQPDPHYTYEFINMYEMTGYRLFVLNMTSQKWLDETVSNRPIWWHYLLISVPDKITRPDLCSLWIQGGSNIGSQPDSTDHFVRLMSMMAVGTGSIGANLFQVPNAPVIFKKDPKQMKRYEDDIIAWTWKTFIENQQDPNVLLRFPMTKAAYKAMDTVTDFLNRRQIANPTKFMVAGESKRGWTTWTTAAVDPERVFVAVPIVMDMLGLNTNLHAHFQALGGWTIEFDAYYALNVTKYLDTPNLLAMEALVDPKSYLSRYINTKILAITSTGDEFFLPDDTHSYWSDLSAATNGSAMLRRLANTDHSCKGHEISMFFTLQSLLLSAYENVPLPKLRWIRPNNATHGIIIATVDIVNGPAPLDAQVYYANTLSEKRRDFRLFIADPNKPGQVMPNPVLWLSTKTNMNSTRTSSTISYQATFPTPLYGWFGFYIHFSFPGPDGTVLEITTETNIVPEKFPFPDCYRESCYGTLV